jgi:RHS repeat-associated protein
MCPRLCPHGVQIPNVGMFTVNEYDWNRPAAETLPGGATRQYDYDPLMRVSDIADGDPGGNEQLNYHYAYDKVDNITAKATEHGDYAYQYDDLNRLTDTDNPDQADESFDYDDVGNRLASAKTSGDWSYNANNELEGYDDVTFQYDANGNMTEKNAGGVVTKFFYNLEDRLERVEDGTGNVIATYYYDPFGRRLWKDVGGTRTCFFYNDEGLAGEYDAAGVEIKTYGWKPGSTWSTDPLFMKVGSEYYWYHNDHLGTPQMMTTSSGAVVWKAKYSSFGKTAVDPSSTVVSNLRLPGQYFDEKTGLHYNWFRYYDSDLGRYLRIDPLRLSQRKIAIQRIINDIRESSRNGKNGKSIRLLLVANLFYRYELYNIQAHDLYAYVQNNPVTWIDPFGLSAMSDAMSDAITGGTGGLITNGPAGIGGSMGIGVGVGIFIPNPYIAAIVGAVIGVSGADDLAPENGYPIEIQNIDIDVWRKQKIIDEMNEELDYIHKHTGGYDPCP